MRRPSPYYTWPHLISRLIPRIRSPEPFVCRQIATPAGLDSTMPPVRAPAPAPASAEARASPRADPRGLGVEEMQCPRRCGLGSNCSGEYERKPTGQHSRAGRGPGMNQASRGVQRGRAIARSRASDATPYYQRRPGPVKGGEGGNGEAQDMTSGGIHRRRIKRPGRYASPSPSRRRAVAPRSRLVPCICPVRRPRSWSWLFDWCFRDSSE